MTSAGSVGGDDRIRLFLALQLPAATLDVVGRWQAEQIPAGRQVAREHLHVTLAFLGGRPARELPSIVDALRDAMRVVRRIAFEPASWRETRSVGMVVLRDLGGEASGLARRLHARLEELGVYRPEPRPWLPHLTVVRFRERPRLQPPLPELGLVVPSGAAVYHSVLRPTGARYVALQEFGVGGG